MDMDGRLTLWRDEFIMLAARSLQCAQPAALLAIAF